MSKQIPVDFDFCPTHPVLYIRSVLEELRKPSIGQHVAAPASTLNHLDRPLRPPRVAARREASEVLGKYQFHVVAASIADAVMSLGGLIFDRAMAGWEVTVLVDGDADRAVDDRPVRILGARAVRRSARLPRPHLLAVATDVIVKRDAVRRHVLEIDDETEVLVWGRHRPTNLGRTFVALRHQPSGAAQVFKSCALAAVGVQAIPRADEGVYSMA